MPRQFARGRRRVLWLTVAWTTTVNGGHQDVSPPRGDTPPPLTTTYDAAVP